MRKPLYLMLGLALAGCYGEYVPDYRELYPVRVRLQPAALPLAFPANRTEISTAQAVQRQAVAAGIAPSDIEAHQRDSDSRPGEVMVSYERAIVEVPSCGDWSKNTAWDATNTTGVNFGCATQRNLGLQASDPADLVRARVAGEHDSQRADDVMQKYRTGKQGGAQQPVGWSFSNSFAAGTGGAQ